MIAWQIEWRPGQFGKPGWRLPVQNWTADTASQRTIYKFYEILIASEPSSESRFTECSGGVVRQG